MSRRAPFTLRQVTAVAQTTWSITFLRDGSEIFHEGTRIEARAFALCYDAFFLCPHAPLSLARLTTCERLDLCEREAAMIAEVEEENLNALLYA